MTASRHSTAAAAAHAADNRRPVHPPGGAVRRFAGASQPGRARPAGRGREPTPERCLARRGLRAGLGGARRSPGACAAPSGLDATEAMLEEARRLAAAPGVDNVAWHRGDVYALPFADGVVRHRQLPLRVPSFAGAGARVRRDGARVPARRPHRAVRCRGLRRSGQGRRASTPWSGTATPRRWSSARSGFCAELFADAGLPEPTQRFYGVPAERDRLVAMAFPANDDRAGLRAMIDRGRGRRHAWASTPAATATRCGSSIRRWCWWR